MRIAGSVHLMEISVVIPTYNQRERLRLVLHSLANQTLEKERFEIVVVDDGSEDGTIEMLESKGGTNLRSLSFFPNRGRNWARNRGIEASRGDLIVFLDGDALPAPDLLEVYSDAHQEYGDQAVLCGFQYCLPDLEYFQDPQSGSLIDLPLSSVMRDYIDTHLEEMVLTEEMVQDNFKAVQERAREGAYPFEALKKFQDQVREAFAQNPAGVVNWLGFVPHNGAVPRSLLRGVGGFDEEIPFSEGWEIALRLQRGGAGIFSVDACSYHLYHPHGFRKQEDLQQEERQRHRAIEYMADKHSEFPIRLLYFWFAHLWPDPFIPEEAVVKDLVELDLLFRTMTEEKWRDYLVVLKHHPLR